MEWLGERIDVMNNEKIHGMDRFMNVWTDKWIKKGLVSG